MTEKLNITEWALDDRPREKLAAKGPEALSDAELLAILIGSGNTHETAVDLMRRILQDCDGSLQRLSRKTITDLTGYEGVGPAKAITIMAACELGRRRAREGVMNERIESSAQIAAYFRPRLQDLPLEECHVMLLGSGLKFLESRLVSRGGLSASTVDVRVVLREALMGGAVSIALCHNHPSGSLRPSEADLQVTKLLAEACKAVQIRLIDHVIVSSEGYYSFSDEGKI